MAFITHAPALRDSSSDPALSPAQRVHHAHHFSLKRVCLGLLLLCIAVAALALPLVRQGLNLLQAQAHWQPLEQWLAQAPMASWLMMFVWGSMVPISLILMLRHQRNVLGVLAALGFAAIAVIWYIHMPAQTQCAALYSDSTWCTVIAWGYSLSLGIANAVYLFALVMALVGGISVAATQQDDTSA